MVGFWWHPASCLIDSFFLSCVFTRERERDRDREKGWGEKWSLLSSLHTRALSPSLGLHSQDSPQPDYLPKAPPLNIITLEAGASTHRFRRVVNIPTDRGAWWATVHRVTESQTRLNDWAQTNSPPCLLLIWLTGKQSTCQCRRHGRCGFDPGVGKIPWRRKWQPTAVFLLGKLHASPCLEEPGGLQFMRLQRVGLHGACVHAINILPSSHPEGRRLNLI